MYETIPEMRLVNIPDEPAMAFAAE
jgi:hypothetical protein